MSGRKMQGTEMLNEFKTFIAKGNVEAMPDFAAFDPDNLLIQQWNGRFVEQGDRVVFQ